MPLFFHKKTTPPSQGHSDNAEKIPFADAPQNTLTSWAQKKSASVPWIILGATLLLGMSILLFSWQRIVNSERISSAILLEKGASLIKALEAGARIDMRVGSFRLQYLLEELGSQPDIAFISVTDKDGTILADNDPRRVGTSLFGTAGNPLVPVSEQTQFGVFTNNDEEFFVTFREFSPLTVRSLHNGAQNAQKSARPNAHRHATRHELSKWESCMTDAEVQELARVDSGAGQNNADLRTRPIPPQAPPPTTQTTRYITDSARPEATQNDSARGLWEKRRARHERPNSTIYDSNQAQQERAHALQTAQGSPQNSSQKSAREQEARQKRWQALWEQASLSESLPIIYVAFDIAPYSAACAQDRQQSLLMGAVMLLLVIMAAFALLWAKKERASREKIAVLQQALRLREKQASIGNLAAGVAHELRNPLSSIKGYASYFGSRFPKDSEDRKAAEVMVQEVERLNRVISDLIGLSSPSELMLRPMPPTTVAENIVRLIRHDAEARNVEIRFVAGEDLPLCPMDADRMTQALLNLCLNALDAMKHGGVLTLGIDVSPDSPVYAGTKAQKNAPQLCFRIHDTGEGIAPKTLAHIFDPYFTTKAQGTGLGLAIVHKIIEAHGGHIRVHSEAGSTAFSVFLPIEAASPMQHNSGNAPAE